MRKYWKNLKVGWRHSPVSSLPSRNQTLAIAVKKHAKVDIKLFFSCPILLDFSTLARYFVGDCICKICYQLVHSQCLFFTHYKFPSVLILMFLMLLIDNSSGWIILTYST